MNRRDAMQGIATALLAPSWPVGRALAAGLGFAWGVVPTIAVVGAADDPRQALVRDAVAFWNQTLGELRSGFRLGTVAWQEGSVPDDLIVALSESTLKGMKRPFPEPLGSIRATSSLPCRMPTSSRFRCTGRLGKDWSLLRAVAPTR
jgi:hypothetical protein